MRTCARVTQNKKQQALEPAHVTVGVHMFLHSSEQVVYIAPVLLVPLGILQLMPVLHWFRHKPSTSSSSASRRAATASVMQAALNDLADNEPANASLPTRSVDAENTCTPESLAERVHVFLDHGTHTWFAVNNITLEIQPLPQPHLSWTVDMQDGKATLVDIAADTFIDAFEYFSFQLWKQSSDDGWVVRDSWRQEQPMLALSTFLTKHRTATLHVRSLTGIGYQTHHKITVFMFDTLCAGSSAYWSMTELLASLGIKNPAVYLRCNQKDYNRARLKYELNDLDTTGRGDAAMEEHKPGCTQSIILLLARGSFRSKHHGGFGDDETRSTCESLLRTLCTATHTGQTMRMSFCLKRDVKRHECGAIIGNDVVVISVQHNGIVDFSELRVRAQADTEKKKEKNISNVDEPY